MSRVVRSVANAMALLGILGCDDFLGIGGDLEVAAIAEVQEQGKVISLTVENHSSDPIYYSMAWLERRERDDWLSAFPGPRLDYLPAPVKIEPGEDHAGPHTSVSQLSPGTF